MLSRPENVVHFFHNILKVPCITKDILGMRTKQYNGWVESYARNHKIPMEWAQKGIRKSGGFIPAFSNHQLSQRS